MDISSGAGYPAANLSNFHPHSFVFDGVECASMEGLLQSFKCPHQHIQIEICKLVGRAAKFKGKKYKWFKTQELYWKGVTYKRDSEEYQQLLDRAFDALNANELFKKALKSTNSSTLTHSIGKNKINLTVLTENEFISRLTQLRNKNDN